MSFWGYYLIRSILYYLIYVHILLYVLYILLIYTLLKIHKYLVLFNTFYFIYILLNIHVT